MNDASWLQSVLTAMFMFFFLLWAVWSNIKAHIRSVENDVGRLRKELEYEREQRRELQRALYRIPLSR